MGILVYGVSHRNASLALRERLAVPTNGLDRALASLTDLAREGVIVSTCNRTEVYAVTGHHRSGREALARFLSAHTGVPTSEFASSAYDYWQEEAVRHLFRVAAGLDSMIVGEPQILGQVREAYLAASARESAGPLLSRLFRHALEVGKAARSDSGISRGAASVSSAAVELARNRLGSLEGRTVLVVGAGEAGEAAAGTLMRHGASSLLVTSRTLARAQALATRNGGEALPFSKLQEACGQADIVITCTSSPDHVLTHPLVCDAMAGRADRPLVIVDIAVPRDVEPAVGQLVGVHLLNLDDLQTVVAQNLEVRRREAEVVERQIELEVPRFMTWWDQQDVIPTIRALTERAETIRRAELARAMPRLNGISQQDRDTLDALTAAIVKKLLHDPIVRLKQRRGGEDGNSHVRAVHELFCLDEVAP